jgi:hypothetical protein
MKTFPLQPASVLIGALGCSLVVAVLGFAAPAQPERSVFVNLAPVPADHVRIVEGVPFEVPEGRTVTLKMSTVAGAPGFGAQVQIDGMAVYNGSIIGEAEEIPFGITAFSGEVITVSQEFPAMGSTAIVFGYLSDA